MRLRAFSYYLTVWYHLFKRSMQKVFVHRIEFISKLVRILMVLGMQFILVAALFTSTAEIVGWSVDQYYLLLGVYNLINYIGWATFNVNLWRLEEKIIRGEFDRLLLYPMKSYFTASFIEFFPDDGVGALSGLIFIGYYLARNPQSITFGNLMLFLAFLLCGLTIWYSLNLFVASFNFIAPRNALLDLLKSASRLGSVPVDIYSGPLQLLFYTALPFALITNLPVTALTGSSSLNLLLYSVVMAILFFLLAISCWNLLIRKYTSFGG